MGGMTIVKYDNDKHAPKRSKRIRKKGNVPWFSKTVKHKLFERDHFKRKAIKINNENNWKLRPSGHTTSFRRRNLVENRSTTSTT